MKILAWIASEAACAAIAVALIWRGHWIAGCIMAVLLTPFWRKKERKAELEGQS
jgi:hypothetical protein